LPRFPARVKALLLLTAICAGATPAQSRAEEATPDRPDALVVEFYFTPGCRLCGPAKQAVRAAEIRFGDCIRVRRLDLSDRTHGIDAALRLGSRLDAAGVPQDETPSLAVFAGTACLAGGEAIVADLDTALERELARDARAAPPSGSDTADTARFGFWAVTAAGLADGVNPCAFATLVLLVSMLATARRTRRETLLVGIGFGAGVYLAYFAIGLGLYALLQESRGVHVVSDLVVWLAFGLCIAFALFSLLDAWRNRSEAGRDGMLLKLPEGVRDRIRKRIGAGVRADRLAAAAFVSGGAVAILESLCTGQVYFPVLAGLARSDGTRWRGLGLIAWYNGMFILPLAGVLAAALLGVESRRLAAFARRRLPVAKVLLAAVFLLMAAWLAPALVWPPGTR
jgi:hypothetical protein